MIPFRIEIKPQCIVSVEQLRCNAAINAGRQRIKPGSCIGRRLAVCGGGPLLADELDTLRNWSGDIWAINYTVEWLQDRGIQSTLFTVDPQPFKTSAQSAILSTLCHQDVFDQLGDRALAFDSIETDANGLTGGTASASRAPAPAILLGYRDITFFGCEGSLGEASHVDRNEQYAAQMIIRAGGEDYRTIPPFLVQCEELARMISTFPDVFHNGSGGLLSAMLAHPDTWEVVGVSAALKEHLIAVNGDTGLYDEPYKAVA